MTDPMLPVLDPSNEFFWNAAQERKFKILCCKDCGNYVHLPRPVCSKCHSFNLEGKEVSGKGTLYSFTTVYKAFHPYFVDKIPYLIATVELAEQKGLMFNTNLVDADENSAKIGMPVEVDFRPLGESFLIPVFKPARGAK